jgi:hypothetical protein
VWRTTFCVPIRCRAPILLSCKTALEGQIGEGGIRTPDSLATMSDFETGLPYIVINHLADGWSLSALVGIVFLSL